MRIISIKFKLEVTSGREGWECNGGGAELELRCTGNTIGYFFKLGGRHTGTQAPTVLAMPSACLKYRTFKNKCAQKTTQYSCTWACFFLLLVPSILSIMIRLALQK